MTKPDFSAAARFLAERGRALDRRRFERFFGDGEARPVRDAGAAYRNPDGGFGQGLEPDLRTPASQPAAVGLALATLHEADAWDDELAAEACDWLQAHPAEGGGAVFAEPGLDAWPHAPWWQPPPGRPASLIQTGQLAGTLHARRVRHPWLDAATEVMWRRIAELTEAGPYDMLGVFRFLDHVPDRDRARRAARQAGELLLGAGLVALDPEEPGETHSPLDYAPRPESTGRELFEPGVIERHLDHLAGAQRADGGWMFNWTSWSPAAESDWRGSITVDNLHLLRQNGRC